MQIETFIECIDTINHLLDIPGKFAQEKQRTTDEFNRVIVILEVAINEWV